jgi:GNAT superfamily N-acetyltransferase
MIRHVRPGDYPAVAQVAAAAFPGMPFHANELQEEDTPVPPQLCERWVAEENGQILGSASYFQSQTRYHPQKFWMDLFVAPSHQGEGVGSTLLNQILTAIAPHNPILLRGATREDLTHGVRFCERHGFVEGKRTWVSHLDLAATDLSRFAGADVEIRTLAELQGCPGWEELLLELYNAVQLDVPDIDPPSAVTMEQFRQGQFFTGTLPPDAQFIALDGDRWIGLTGFSKPSQPDWAWTGLTGVLPQYRGQGMATALKLRALTYARAMGWKRISTMNASTNRPMLAINEKLGFAKEPAWIHMVKTF